MQRNELQHQAPVLCFELDYELAELWQFERGTEEASAVKTALGSPTPKSQQDNAVQPLIIVGYDTRSIGDLLLEQRSLPQTRMRPIAVVGVDQNHPVDPLIDQLADVLLPPRPSLDALLEAGRDLDALSQQVRKMPQNPGDAVLALLQLLYSRNQALEPTIDAGARMAYDYPLATVVMGVETHSALDTLNDLARHNMLESAPVDRVFVCPDCRDYRIPVKELCPECHSPNLSMQESIHHFRCGHVAPESDFMTQGKPVCPKCHSALRHIGVEYNRPGHFTVCHDCGHWASEPEIRAWCVACNTHHLPCDLVPVHIKRFKLGENGMHVASAGDWDPNAWPAFAASAVKQIPPADNHAIARTQDFTRMLIRVAGNDQTPMTIYRITLTGSEVNAEQQADKIEKLLLDKVSDPDLLARVAPDTFLMVLPRSDAQASGNKQIEHEVARKLNMEIHSEVLAADHVADLMAQA